MLENRECRLCQLADTYPATPCLQGLGNPDTAKLLIYMDAPMFQDDIRHKPFISEPGQFLINMLGRMSLTLEDVYLDYILKCYAGKKMPKEKASRLACYQACSFYRFATLQNMPNVKRIVGMGRLTLEALIGSSELKEFEGECWTPRETELRCRVPHVWITYSPAYCAEKKAEIPNVYRIIFVAAQEAGLNPKPNLKHPHFKWEE